MSFDPSTKHKHYEKHLFAWQRQRDAVGGEDQVKTSEHRTKYLPRLEGQGNEIEEFRYRSEKPLTSYEAYKSRASFMNATGRTRDGLVGAVMRRAPRMIWPTSQEEMLDVLGVNLESWHEIVHMTLDETIGIGRYGHLIDVQPDGGDPFIATYIAEAITNWVTDLIGGRRKPVRIHLREEPYRYDTKARRMLERYRVLHLGFPMPYTSNEMQVFEEEGAEGFLALYGLASADFNNGPVYFQEVWDEAEAEEVENEEGGRWIRTELTVPKRQGGRPLDEIPFVFFNSIHNRVKTEKPPLLDLTVVNMSHYRNSADMEHGLHFTALPQPWVAGFNFDGPLYIGSGAAWVSEDPQARAGYLEFSGQGLRAIKETMDDKKKEMAALGARLIEEQHEPGGGESAETVKIRHSGEGSALARITDTVSKGLTNVLKLIADFKGISATPSIELNTDFGVYGLSPVMLQSLMAQVQAGLMSWETYIYNLDRGEVYPDDWSAEKEATAIMAGPPGRTYDELLGIRQQEPEDEAQGDEEDEEAEAEDEDEQEEEN